LHSFGVLELRAQLSERKLWALRDAGSLIVNKVGWGKGLCKIYINGQPRRSSIVSDRS